MVTPSLQNVRNAAAAAVVAVFVLGHEDAAAAGLGWAFLAQPGHVVVVIDFVELQHRKFHLLVLVLLFLRFGVGLSLALLASTKQLQALEESRLLFIK